MTEPNQHPRRCGQSPAPPGQPHRYSFLKEPQDIWTLRQIGARRVFIDYAGRIAAGEFDGETKATVPHILRMIGIDRNFRSEVELTGIGPGGDTRGCGSPV